MGFLGVTVGLCLSPVYLLAATNIAEVGLALPFFVGTLLLLAGRQPDGWTFLEAGVLAGLTAIFYAIAGCLVPGIAAAVILTRFPFRSAIKPLLLFLSASGLVFTGIWVTVLIASGYHTLNSLRGAIFQFPQQGTFLNFKIGSLIATLVGLTQGFLPVLPDDFVGLRSLFQQTPWSAACVTVATSVRRCFSGDNILRAVQTRQASNSARSFVPFDVSAGGSGLCEVGHLLPETPSLRRDPLLGNGSGRSLKASAIWCSLAGTSVRHPGEREWAMGTQEKCRA